MLIKSHRFLFLLTEYEEFNHWIEYKSNKQTLLLWGGIAR
jgi:hypothetical protein